MPRSTADFLTRLVFFFMAAFAMVSCTGGPQSKALSHVFEERSRLHIVTARNFPNAPQVRLRVKDGKRMPEWHKRLEKGEFEGMWSMFMAEDLRRFRDPNQGPAIVNVRENYIFRLGDASNPASGEWYKIPVSQAPPSVKMLAQQMRGHGSLLKAPR